MENRDGKSEWDIGMEYWNGKWELDIDDGFGYFV
jgi:hypothetical protein